LPISVSTLRTVRLDLRPPLSSDVADIVRLAGGREVAATTLRIPHPYTDADAERFIAAAARHADADQSVVFAMEVRDTAQFVGAIGLELQLAHRKAELGYWIGVPFWGNGYATEAARAVIRYGFDELNLNRIYASYITQNPASGRVLRKIGMKHEGTLRGHILKWDVFHDSEFFGILRDDPPSAPN
jgi:[ribosomal protein S5]-alanine N-acetyltransferase